MFALRPAICAVVFFLCGKAYSDSCSEYQSDATACWNDHKDLPICTLSDPILECVSKAYSSALPCDESVVDDIKMKEDMYQLLHEIVCDRTEIHKEFARDLDCWILARNCAYGTLLGTFDNEEMDDDRCEEIEEVYEACKGPLRDSPCSKLQDRLIREIREKSRCSGSMSLNAANISIPALTMSRGKQIWLTIFFIVLELSKPTIQFKGWSVLAGKCDEALEKVEDCWIEHSDLPSCNGDDLALECAKEAKANLKNCKKEIKDEVLQRFHAIKALREVMCENTELKDEFEKKISCWHTARSCSSRLGMMFHDDDSDESEDYEESSEESECSQLLDDIENCNSMTAGCTKIQNNFTYELFEKSPCAAHAEKLMSDSENNACLTMCNFFTVIVMTTLLASVNW
uniref:Secreted protein n=1 Tax=Strigamia maritima TaxID=126957 RepID=T1J7X1_STRMM